MVESLAATLGLYGGALVIAFVAGMFPLVSIELFLFGCALAGVATDKLIVMVPLGVIGHQIAKSITYYAGAGAFELPHGKVRAKIEAARHRIERWNRWPRAVMFVSAGTGLPPLYVLGFVAQPLMHMRHGTFTLITATGRLLRYTTLVIVARQLY